MDEKAVRACGGPSNYSTSFANVRSKRHLLKRAPKTYVSLCPPERETLTYFERDDGTRMMVERKRFNSERGWREVEVYSDGYLFHTKVARPGHRWMVVMNGFDVDAGEYEIVKVEPFEMDYAE